MQKAALAAEAAVTEMLLQRLIRARHRVQTAATVPGAQGMELAQLQI
jgi:hypothetical protein